MQRQGTGTKHAGFETRAAAPGERGSVRAAVVVEGSAGEEALAREERDWGEELGRKMAKVLCRTFTRL